MSVAPRSKQSGPQASAESSGGKAKVSPAKPAEMSAEVIEFIQAIDEYKRLQQRPFPSWSEVLDVLKSLGYTRPE
jgi:hypothetical protein